MTLTSLEGSLKAYAYNKVERECIRDKNNSVAFRAKTSMLASTAANSEAENMAL